MSCHGCAEAFGFWRRELGCPSCGFAYCKKCLRFKLEPTEDGTALTVCSKCYNGQKLSPDENIAANNEWKTASQALKDIQVLEAMDNPAKPPITVYRESESSNRYAKLKKGLSVDDQKLVERLAELSDDRNRGTRRKSEQPEHDLAARLAKLKGEEVVPTAGSHTIDGKSILLTQKPVTEVDLLDRLAKEVEIQKDYDTSVVGDIETRLGKLRGEPGSSAQPSVATSDSTLPDPDEEMDEEDQVQRIISRYVAEAALSVDKDEGEAASDEDVERHSDSDDDDLDFDKLCRICEEKRATINCEECDGDIFCKACFKEFHDELGETHEPTSIPRSEEQ